MLIVGSVDFFPSAGRKELRDGRIVLGRVGEGLLHKLKARIKSERTAMVGEFLDEIAVIERIGDGGDAKVVLGTRADHAGAADVDVRAGHLGRYAILSDRLAERIEVYDDHIESVGVEALQIVLMGVVVLLGKNAEIDLEVERLDQTALHLGLAGVVRNGNERSLGGIAENLFDLGVCSAGRINLNAGANLDESGDKRLEARFVAHAHKNVLYLNTIVDFGDDIKRHCCTPI